MVQQVTRAPHALSVPMSGGAPDSPVVLLGDNMDMAHVLRTVAPQVTVVARRTAPARYSRHGFRCFEDPRPDEEALLALLNALGSPAAPAALFYERDRDLLFVSRNRARLGSGVTATLPAAPLVEQLVDKAAFAELARSLQLPVPASRTVGTRGPWREPDTPYPVLVKPTTRNERWRLLAQGQKAVVVRDADELRSFVRHVAEAVDRVLLQTYVPGPETCVESYHVYVDPQGEIVADFTGRKIRTWPPTNGFSTALVTTDQADVRALGRSLVGTLGLTGVAKLDIKRDQDDRLWLLEVNPRFNLWHRLGAAAGVNLPALALADLRGAPRPPVGDVRPGVTWCRFPLDLFSARRSGVPAPEWARWAMRCTAQADLDVRDPLPYLAGRVLPKVLDRVKERSPALVRGRRNGQS